MGNNVKLWRWVSCCWVACLLHILVFTGRCHLNIRIKNFYIDRCDNLCCQVWQCTDGISKDNTYCFLQGLSEVGTGQIAIDFWDAAILQQHQAFESFPLGFLVKSSKFISSVHVLSCYPLAHPLNDNKWANIEVVFFGMVKNWDILKCRYCSNFLAGQMAAKVWRTGQFCSSNNWRWSHRLSSQTRNNKSYPEKESCQHFSS